MIWNIKYIPRFKWIHLSERLAYEKAAYKQRLRAEISQAKKEAQYLQANVEKSKRLKKKKPNVNEHDIKDSWNKQTCKFKLRLLHK